MITCVSSFFYTCLLFSNIFLWMLGYIYLGSLCFTFWPLNAKEFLLRMLSGRIRIIRWIVLSFHGLVLMHIFAEVSFLTNGFSFAAHIPLYLYPFLNTTSKSRPFEYLRLTSLGVIGALVKVLCSADVAFYGSYTCMLLCVYKCETLWSLEVSIKCINIVNTYPFARTSYADFNLLPRQ